MFLQNAPNSSRGWRRETSLQDSARHVLAPPPSPTRTGTSHHHSTRLLAPLRLPYLLLTLLLCLLLRLESSDAFVPQEWRSRGLAHSRRRLWAVVPETSDPRGGWYHPPSEQGGFWKTVLAPERSAVDATSATTRETLVASRRNTGRTVMQESSDTPEDDAEPAGEDTSNERADESSTNEARQSSKSNEEGSSEESVKENIADTIARRQAALYRSGLLKKQPPTRKAATAEKNTSLGERRVKSATQARRGVRRTTQLVDAVRQKARGIASSTPSPATNDADNNAKEAKGGDVKNRLSASRIHATVEELFKKRRKASTKSQSDRFTAALSSWGTSIGILGEIGESPKTEVLLESTSLVVRVATPMDDVDIANLRLSVFSDFSPDMRSQFCFRSCQALAHRRTRGAICVVATPPPTMVRPLVLGSAECSYHEFHSTRLGSRRLKDSLLYITEVAVHPSTRRQGTGVQMLEAIDDLAERQDIETIYLHVDVCNYAALNLYKKCGYALADEKDPTFQEFTESLNLHPGATRGRDHHLLYKNLRTPTWLEQRARQPEDKTRVIGSLGFEIPA